MLHNTAIATQHGVDVKFPDRFATGYLSRTIPNPARTIDYRHSVGDPGVSTFEGCVEDYDFEKQTDNFNRLQAVLAANGTRFLYVAASHSPGDRGVNHRFAACAENGSLMWYKYVSYVAQGGQNHVFVARKRISTSAFLALNAQQQAALLLDSRSAIRDAFQHQPTLLKQLDDTRKLWS